MRFVKDSSSYLLEFKIRRRRAQLSSSFVDRRRSVWYLPSIGTRARAEVLETLGESARWAAQLAQTGHMACIQESIAHPEQNNSRREKPARGPTLEASPHSVSSHQADGPERRPDFNSAPLHQRTRGVSNPGLYSSNEPAHGGLHARTLYVRLATLFRDVRNPDVGSERLTLFRRRAKQAERCDPVGWNRWNTTRKHAPHWCARPCCSS
jgi:hypothetical protein